MEPVPENSAHAAYAARIAVRRMSEPGFNFDEVGDWSILKLNIIENYAAALARRPSALPRERDHAVRRTPSHNGRQACAPAT